MSYEEFSNFEVGTVKLLWVAFGSIRFVKSSDSQFLVMVSLNNEEAFKFTRFTQVMSTIEASTLFDSYSEKQCSHF